MNNLFKNLNFLKKYPFFRNILFPIFLFPLSIIIFLVTLIISIEINNNFIRLLVYSLGVGLAISGFSEITTSIQSIKPCKVRTKKTLTRYEKLFPQIDIELQNHSTINFPSSKIYLTKNYIISYQLGLDIIPLEDITEIIITSKNFTIIEINTDPHTLSITLEDTNLFISHLKCYAPHINWTDILPRNTNDTVLPTNNKTSTKKSKKNLNHLSKDIRKLIRDPILGLAIVSSLGVPIVCIFIFLGLAFLSFLMSLACILPVISKMKNFNKRTQKTLTLYENILSQIDEELHNSSTIYSKSQGIYITKNYLIYSELSSGFTIIPLENIKEILINRISSSLYILTILDKNEETHILNGILSKPKKNQICLSDIKSYIPQAKWINLNF